MSINIILIAAFDKNRAIGFKNDLPWHLPDDFKRFKEITKNQVVVMGYNTALSIKKALPNRTNIVLTSKKSAPFEDMMVFADIESVISWAKQENIKDLYIVGGAQIYSAFLPLATHLDLTFIDGEFENADTFFPKVDLTQFKEINRLHHPKDERHRFSFDHVQFEKIKK